MIIHTGEKPYKCKVCELSFWTNSYLTRHSLVHSDVKPHECSTCQKRFKVQYHLISHENVVHKRLTCLFCHKLFGRQRGLNSHINLHIQEKHYICGKCGLPFSRQPCLNRHTLRHSNSRGFTCEDRGKGFKTQHRLLHTAGEKPRVCIFHGKRFSRSSHGFHHIRMHTREKPYMCRKCGVGFTYPASLRNHKLFSCAIKGTYVLLSTKGSIIILIAMSSLMPGIRVDHLTLIDYVTKPMPSHLNFPCA